MPVGGSYLLKGYETALLGYLRLAWVSHIRQVVFPLLGSSSSSANNNKIFS